MRARSDGVAEVRAVLGVVMFVALLVIALLVGLPGAYGWTPTLIAAVVCAALFSLFVVR